MMQLVGDGGAPEAKQTNSKQTAKEKRRLVNEKKCSDRDKSSRTSVDNFL